MKNLKVFLLFFVLLFPITCRAEDFHVALDLWGYSHHAERNKNYNERNWGFGGRVYYGNWFAAVDDMKNSVRGKAVSVGIGYEYPLFTVSGHTVSAVGELSYLKYGFPNKGTLHGTIFLPGASVRNGNWSGNVVLIPKTGKRKEILLFSLTRHFDAF